MSRKEKLILIAADYAQKSAVAEKYAEHLEELFDSIVPGRIGAGIEEALREERFSDVVRLCAAHYRQKPNSGVSGLSATGGYSVEDAEKAIKGIMREVNIDWTFPDGQIDFLFDPTEVKGPLNHEWLWQFNRHGYWANMAKVYAATGDEKYAEAFDYAIASCDDGFGEEEKRLAIHTREVRFCKPGFFCIKDRMTAADGQKHSYEALFHLDTTTVKRVDEYENAAISEYGRTYELLMIPLDEEDNVPQMNIVSGQTEPVFQGWYNGRNENNLHRAITVSREVKDAKEYQFTTLLFPVKKGTALPSVRKQADGMIEVTFEGRDYRVCMDGLFR